ncbi:MAG: glycosyltransferase [Acidimicrobiia bacterium]|nr:glycosyltransferase [Acidimicrobiia bacterium]
MRVLYLTWGETPRISGVYGSQVVRLLGYLNGRDRPLVDLCAGVPIVNSAWTRERSLLGASPGDLTAELGGGQFHRVMIPTVQTAILKPPGTWRGMVPAMSLRSLASIVRQTTPDIVHARSYHACWAAVQVRAQTGEQFRVVFDPRGILPHEVLLRSRSRGPKALRRWLSIERDLLDRADVVVAVSDTMRDYFVERGARRVVINYLASDDRPTIGPRAPDRSEAAKAWTFVYAGALGENTWHSAHSLARLYGCLRRLAPRPCSLRIVSGSPEREIRKAFADLPDHEVEVLSAPSAREVASLMEDCTIGLLPFRGVETDSERVVGHTMLGTKTVEYICAGLPVLVNRDCGGADALLAEHGIGLSFDLTDLDLSAEALTGLASIDRGHIAAVGSRLFSYRSWSDRAMEIYSTTLS